MEKVTLSRKQLHDLVWSTSLLALSKKYNISDVGLRKICIRMNIPLPNKSYWRRIQGGKSVLIKSLPRDYLGKNEVVLNVRQLESNTKQSTVSLLKMLVQEIENDPTLPLRVPDRLTNPNKLVILARETLSKNENRFTIYKGIAETDEGELKIRVAPALIPRALRFFDALIKLLRSRNHDVLINSRWTYAVINGEHIEIWLKEKLQIVKTNAKYPETEYHPVGVLMLKTEGKHTRIWTDGKQPLEDQLAKILAWLELEGKRLHEERLEREEQHRIWEEERRIAREERERKEREIAKFNNLLQQANQWQQAQILRQYIAAIEEKAFQEGVLTDELKEWLECAKNITNLNDPILAIKSKVK